MRKGFALFSVVFFLALVTLVGAFVVKLVSSDLTIASSDELHLKAFYAAEAGIEWGKTKLVANTNWYTDPVSSRSGDTGWLMNDSAGYHFKLNDVSIKVVREDASGSLYSIGYVGEDLERAKAISMIRMKFKVLPFEALSWENM